MSCGDGLINFEFKMHFQTLEQKEPFKVREASFQSSSEQDELFVRTRQRMRIESFEESKQDSKFTLDTLDFSAVTKKFKVVKNFDSDQEEDPMSKLLKESQLNQDVIEINEFENIKEENLEILNATHNNNTAQSNEKVVKINFAQRNLKIRKKSKKIEKDFVNISKSKINNKVVKVKLFWSKKSKQIPSVFYLSKKLGNKQYKEWQCYAKKEVLIAQDSQQFKKIEFSSLQKICSENQQCLQDTDFSFDKNFD